MLIFVGVDVDFRMHVQDLELAALCEHHMVSVGSHVNKARFREIAVDGLFVVAHDELRNGEVVNNTGVTRCTQVSDSTTSHHSLYL